MQDPSSTTPGSPRPATRPSLLFACLLGLTSTLAAQGEKERVQDSAKEMRRRALRLIRQLELPDRRAEVAPKLLAMGADAVPALILALNDPRPDVVARLALIVRALGAKAKPTLPLLRKMAKDKDKKIAFAAGWALSVFEPKGIILISDNSGPVQELDEKGKVLFTMDDSKGSYQVERLPNGNYLVCKYGKHKVSVVTRKGKEVWSCDALKSPSCARRLPSGHTLISSTNANKVVEVDPSGKVVWSHKIVSPYSVSRLNNGNTLIPSYSGNKVVEVDPAGKEVWSYTGAKYPLDAQRLPNGNTLVMSYSGKSVHEVSPKGKKVAEISVPGSLWAGHRRVDGKTYLAGHRFVIAVDKKGKRLMNLKLGNFVTSVHLY